MRSKLGKYKVYIIIMIILAAIAVSFVVSSFTGNPFSKLAAGKSVKEAINTKYNNMELIIDNTVFDYTCGHYVVNVKSRTSKDTYFSFYCNKAGVIKKDNYKESVIDHGNTWFRVNEKYSGYVCRLMQQKLKYDFSNLEPSVNYDHRSELKVDKEYDIHDSDLKGKIEAYIYTDELTWENLANITRDIDEVLRNDGLNIENYTVGLCKKSDPVIKICVNDFKRELLASDDLPRVMEDNNKQLEK